MYKYLAQINPPKTRITLQNLNGLINNNLLPKNKMGYAKLYNFGKYLKAFADGEKLYVDDRAYKYFSDHFDIGLLQQNKKGTYISQSIWVKLYDNKMVELKEYLKANQDKYIQALQEAEINNIWSDSCSGTLSGWEMESLGFYYHDHELAHVNAQKYGLVDFFKLPEEPVVDKTFTRNGKEVNIFKLHKICGTCIAKNKTKRKYIFI